MSQSFQHQSVPLIEPQHLPTPRKVHAVSAGEIDHESLERRPVALHPRDFAWARATIRHLRARGIADPVAERIIADLVEVFVRRGRHGREVYGTPRVQAATHPAGKSRPLGLVLRRFVAWPLLAAAIAVVTTGVIVGEPTNGAIAGGVLAVLGLATHRLGTVRDSRLPAHITLLDDPIRT